MRNPYTHCFTQACFPFQVGKLLLAALLICGTSLLQAQTIRFVKAGASGDGSSWANASGNLQNIIDASGANDQVWVAQGTYKPTTSTDRTIGFAMKNGVTIYGGFPATGTPALADRNANPKTNNTTLSGDIDNDGTLANNSYHVVKNPSSLNNSSVLDGFMITGGNANGGQPDFWGGGMYNPFSSPSVVNCFFKGNFALSLGGGMFNSQNSSPLITHCTFEANTVTGNGGGALYNGPNSNPRITNSSF